jgi:hypothetical protein
MQLTARLVSTSGARSAPGKVFQVRLKVADISAAEIQVIEVALRHENGFDVLGAGTGALITLTGEFGSWEPIDELLYQSQPSSNERTMFCANSFVIDPTPASESDLLFIEALQRSGAEHVVAQDLLVVETEASLGDTLTFDRKYRFHRTERHGYLEVTGDELRELEILQAISPFSYKRELEDIFLLEEDEDAPLFLRTVAEKLGKSESAIWKENIDDVDAGHKTLLINAIQVTESSSLEMSVDDRTELGLLEPGTDIGSDWEFGNPPRHSRPEPDDD